MLPGGVSKPIPKLTTRLGPHRLSSEGRSLRCDNEVVVDQELVRALASHARGHWFESSTVHHSDQRICLILVIRRAADARQLLASWPLSRSFSSVP